MLNGYNRGLSFEGDLVLNSYSRGSIQKEKHTLIFIVLSIYKQWIFLYLIVLYYLYIFTGAEAVAPGSSIQGSSTEPTQSVYHVKWIKFKGMYSLWNSSPSSAGPGSVSAIEA